MHTERALLPAVLHMEMKWKLSIMHLCQSHSFIQLSYFQDRVDSIWVSRLTSPCLKISTFSHAVCKYLLHLGNTSLFLSWKLHCPLPPNRRISAINRKKISGLLGRVMTDDDEVLKKKNKGYLKGGNE